MRPVGGPRKQNRPAAIAAVICVVCWMAPGAMQGARADIGPVERLIGSDDAFDSLAWSPDGSRIAYFRWPAVASGRALWVANADGSKRTMVVPPSKLHGPPAWSPDGSRLLFSWYDGTFRAVTMNGDGTDPTVLPPLSGGSRSCDWSSDGSRLLYSGDDEPGGLYTVNVDGSDSVRLTDGGEFLGSWSPGGRTVACVVVPAGEEVPRIRLVFLDGSAPIDLSAGMISDHSPRWSPDGSRIAFLSFREGDASIYAMRPDGTDVVRITDHAAADTAPAWSPDGRKIAFVSEREGRKAIYVVDVSEAFPDVVASAPRRARDVTVSGPRPNLHVLSVGISRYAQGPSDAPYANAGARDFAEACRRQSGGYYRAVTVRVLVDEDATARAIRRGLHWLRTSVGEDDVAMCFLSGRGVRDEAGDPHLRAFDTDPARIAGTAVPASDIDRLLGGIASRAVVFADIGEPGLLARRGLTDAEVERYPDYHELPVDTPFVLWAAGGEDGQRSADDAWRNGSFAEALLAGMAGAGDANGNGLINANELSAYVAQELAELTGGTQTFAEFGRGWADIRLFGVGARNPVDSR